MWNNPTSLQLHAKTISRKAQIPKGFGWEKCWGMERRVSAKEPNNRVETNFFRDWEEESAETQQSGQGLDQRSKMVCRRGSDAR